MSKLSFLNRYGFNFSRKNTNTQPNTSNYTARQNSKTFQANMQEMKRVFEKYDRNQDGKISKEEYKAMIRAINGNNNAMNSDLEATKAFQVVDKDGDGFIDFNEYMELHNNKVKSKDIENAFRVFDCDGDGKISAKELMEVLRRMGQIYSLDACKKMIKEFDSNGDGMINSAEFTTMMTTNMKLVT